MIAENAEPDPRAARAYLKALGVRLREIRTQRNLSLDGVERSSHGRWKAVVVSAYERGERAIAVPRLADLARFYGTSVTELLPGHRALTDRARSPATPLLDLEQLRVVAADDAWLLLRFAAAVQRVRHDHGTTLLAIRAADLRWLAIMYDTTFEGLTARLDRWQALVANPRAASDRAG